MHKITGYPVGKSKLNRKFLELGYLRQFLVVRRFTEFIVSSTILTALNNADSFLFISVSLVISKRTPLESRSCKILCILSILFVLFLYLKDKKNFAILHHNRFKYIFKFSIHFDNGKHITEINMIVFFLGNSTQLNTEIKKVCANNCQYIS